MERTMSGYIYICCDVPKEQKSKHDDKTIYLEIENKTLLKKYFLNKIKENLYYSPCVIYIVQERQDIDKEI